MDGQDHARRAAALRAERARLALEVAETAELSARVHDQAADVHARMDRPLLEPEELRRHADKDRRWAEQERQAAREHAGEPDVSPATLPPPPDGP